jgi:hypothetical protein
VPEVLDVFKLIKIAILVDFGTKMYWKSREPQKHGCFADFSLLLHKLFVMMNLALRVNK